MNYLLDYMDEYQVERLKNVFSEVVIQVLIEDKASIIQILEKLKKYGIEDFFLSMVVNIKLFLCGVERAISIIETKIKEIGQTGLEAYMYGYEVGSYVEG